MGSSHSTSQRSKSHHPFKRQRSAVFSRINLACVSINPDSEPSQETSSVDHHDEKSSFRENHPAPTRTTQLAYTPSEMVSGDAAASYFAFLKIYPEYRLTWILDSLRRTDYARLERAGETYVDFMGGALYPESLVRVHADFLSRNVMGNTHSISNSSNLSLKCADEARMAVLTFFKAPPDYTVVFTANATAALKLVGESYPFTGGSNYVLGTDSHNSIHGIRQYAIYRGARVCYVESMPDGGFDGPTTKNILLRNRPRAAELAPSLFALTGASNISNSKSPLSIIEFAASLGYHTLLDAAALVPTSAFSLKEHPVDAMAVSFYKMFGFPTGVGALVIKKSFLAQLRRPWFAGGTVDVVQVPGNIVTRTCIPHEQFEDGTINYLTLPAITDGLQFLSAYLPFLPLRLTCLLHFLHSSLSHLRHETNGAPVVRILSQKPTRRPKSVGDQAETGFMVSLIFLSPTGEMIPNSFIEYSASKQNISLRTGCMCNPGGAAAILGIQKEMRQLYPGVTLKNFENILGRELGVVRVSLGLASNFQDVWKVVNFAASIGKEQSRQALWDRWMEQSGIGQAI